jgi:hypothetical protein
MMSQTCRSMIQSRHGGPLPLRHSGDGDVADILKPFSVYL